MQAGREIKYQAFDTVDGILADVKEIDFEIGVALLYDEVSEWYRTIGEHGAVLRQFTGLRDKNGKEIYEGDIALIYGDRCVIEYDSKSASYVARTKIDSYWALDEETFKLGVEVIGNIYENPELLEVNK